MFYLAAVTWQHLKHSNIVPFVGATHNPLQLVSIWMPGGNLMEYIDKYPEKCRLALVGLIHVRWFSSSSGSP